MAGLGRGAGRWLQLRLGRGRRDGRPGPRRMRVRTRIGSSSQLPPGTHRPPGHCAEPSPTHRPCGLRLGQVMRLSSNVTASAPAQLRVHPRCRSSRWHVRPVSGRTLPSGRRSRILPSWWLWEPFLIAAGVVAPSVGTAFSISYSLSRTAVLPMEFGVAQLAAFANIVVLTSFEPHSWEESIGDALR